MTRKPAREHYNELALRADPLDFSSQVERTVKGKPVDAAQIDMIVDSLLRYLDLSQSDVLLDLCCGNGYVTDRLFDRCRGGLGVDVAEVLIDVAQREFSGSGREYVNQDVVEFVGNYDVPKSFTKCLIYGAFQYFSVEGAQEVLDKLRSRFAHVERVVLGNLPDRAKVREAFPGSKYEPGIEDDNRPPFGLWRTEDDVIGLSSAHGWKATIVRMPSAFYGARYRFDAILTRV